MATRFRGVTGAIQATMRAAHPAGLLQAFAQLMAGAMQAHGQIIRRDAEFLRDLRRGIFRKINFANQFGVFGFERRNDSIDAPADFRFGFFVWCGVKIGF